MPDGLGISTQCECFGVMCEGTCQLGVDHSQTQRNSLAEFFVTSRVTGYIFEFCETCASGSMRDLNAIKVDLMMEDIVHDGFEVFVLR